MTAASTRPKTRIPVALDAELDILIARESARRRRTCASAWAASPSRLLRDAVEGLTGEEIREMTRAEAEEGPMVPGLRGVRARIVYFELAGLPAMTGLPAGNKAAAVRAVLRRMLASNAEADAAAPGGVEESKFVAVLVDAGVRQLMERASDIARCEVSDVARAALTRMRNGDLANAPSLPADTGAEKIQFCVNGELYNWMVSEVECRRIAGDKKPTFAKVVRDAFSAHLGSLFADQRQLAAA